MNKVALDFSNTIKNRLRKHIKKIVLFGSYARGNPTKKSDYDFLILVDRKDKKYRDIVLDVSVEMLDKYNTLIGTIICDKKEWQIKKKFPIGLNIIKEGIEF